MPRTRSSLLASKLPYRMMQHIILNIKPNTFRGWADAARAFHKDNIAVQNIANLGKEGTGHRTGPLQKKKLGFSATELAKILNVKLPLDPNAMDTCADRTRAYQTKQGTCHHHSKMTLRSRRKKDTASRVTNWVILLGTARTNLLKRRNPKSKQRKRKPRTVIAKATLKLGMARDPSPLTPTSAWGKLSKKKTR